MESRGPAAKQARSRRGSGLAVGVHSNLLFDCITLSAIRASHLKRALVDGAAGAETEVEFCRTTAGYRDALLNRSERLKPVSGFHGDRQRERLCRIVA